MRLIAAAPGFAGRLRRSAAICGLHLPLTIVYPVIVLVLFVLSIALLPLFLLGLPLLGVTFAVMRAFASAERGRLRWVLGGSVDAPTCRSTGWWRGVFNDVRSARTWRELGSFVVVLPVLGTIGYLVPFAVAGFGVAAVIVPVLRSTIPTNPVVHLGIHRLGWWWLLFGVAALVAACWVVQGCAYAWSGSAAFAGPRRPSRPGVEPNRGPRDKQQRQRHRLRARSAWSRVSGHQPYRQWQSNRGCADRSVVTETHHGLQQRQRCPGGISEQTTTPRPSFGRDLRPTAPRRR
jgi:hypothetical protein